MTDEAKKEALADLLKGILSGNAELGFSMISLIAAYGKYKMEHGWKEAGFQAWIENDETAPELLGRVLEQARNKLSDETRMKLILALGGVPA